MEHRADTPVVERPASPIVSAPVAEGLDAPLLAIMFHLLGGRNRWRSMYESADVRMANGDSAERG
jgi:hypothetical protein